MLADTSESDKAWDQGDGAAWRPGVTEGSLTEVPSDSPDGSLPQDEPSGEPTPEESSADALVRSVSEGTELLSAALQSAPYDSDNPYTKVEVGKYAPGTYTVTANLFIPASKNPFNQSIQAYMTNPDNPLGIVEPDNGDPGAVTGGVPIFHVEKNATLTVGEDDSITLTVPIRNPVFTLLYSLMLTSPIKTLPSSGLRKRGNILARVVLPQPDAPTNAVTLPCGTSRLMWFKLLRSASG